MRAAALMLALLAAIWPFGGKAHRETEKGNRHYTQGEMEDALRAYTEAQVAAPDAPELHYDIGNVLYAQGEFTGAAEAYTRALASSAPTLAPRVSYNLGNALYRQERYGEAIDAYRRTLLSDPRDAQAKRNLELARRALAKQQRPSPQPKGGGESDPQQGQSAPPEGGEPEPPEDGSKGVKPPPAAGSMSAPEAQRLLDGVAEGERDNLKRARAKQARARPQGREKGW